MSRSIRAACALIALIAGCADRADPAPPRGTVVIEMSAHASPRAGLLEFRRPLADARGSEFGPAISPASVDTIPVAEDGTPGSGPSGTVELVTNWVANTLAGEVCPGVAPGTPAFCGGVTLGHFFGRPLANTFVQVTSITGATQASIAGHQALNSDAPALGLDASLGLWKYTADASSSPGVLGLAPDNTGTRDWVFANPDDTDTWMGIRVVASLTYAGYTRAAASLPFVDACTGGDDRGTVSTSPVMLPFSFTLYDTTDQVVTINRRGVIVLGATDLIAPSKSMALPSSGNVPGCLQIRQCAVPRPAVFPFWDALFYNLGGHVCTQTIGAAPDRAFAVTWSHMGRLGASDTTADYTFTAVLHEGTNVIDLLYGEMNGPLPNAAGGGATVGVQNAAGTAATSETNSTSYGAGASYTLTPVP